MGFLLGFLCGLLVIPLSILAASYYFFTYSESYSEKRQELLEEEKRKETEENELDLEDMPSALYASYLSARQQAGVDSNGLPAMGSMPEHLDPQYQFAGWISVKRIPEVDHRIIEPFIKEKKKSKNGEKNSHKSSHTGTLEGELEAVQDPRFTYFDTQNPHLTLPPSLQARFKDSKYCVIKGATMFIYENEYKNDCLGVITLPNYEVSVPGKQKDGHIFSKRNPILLKFHPISNHARHATAGSEGSPPSEKDYYLSMASCVDKEDLYFTLLRCSKLKLHSRSLVREIPKRDSTLFDKSAMNTLIRTIHSNEHQFQTAWLNAMLGRIFLGVYKTPQVKDMVFQKLVEKLSRVRLPNFLNHMRMKSVHLGDGVPTITRPKLLTLKPNGDMIMDMNLLYQGGFRAEVEAEAVVTVTKKIQPIKVSLVLVITLVRLEGRVQVWIKPPPCNRIWYGFYQKPQVEMKIEPVVSDKHIKSNLIIKAIENKLLEAIAETMVLPNMDDIPFSNTEGVGGIFGEEILPGGEAATTSTDQHHARKTHHAATPTRFYNPGMRANTIDITESSHSTPRSAIELPNDVRHRTESMSIAELYHHGGGARSHPSLGDEVMQVNYSYDSKTRVPSPPNLDDVLQSGIQLSGQPLESPERTTPRTLNVPGGCGIKVSADQPPRAPSPESINSSSSSSKLLNHRNSGQSTDPVRGRSGSLDGSMPSASSTGSSIGSAPNTARTAGVNAVRTKEEHWTKYGISEYEPSALEGGKVSNKDKKKIKEKIKNVEKELMGIDPDRISVQSKESGDNASSYTGSSSLTDTTGQSSTLYGGINGNHSAVESGSKSEKFSLSKIFHGFRKKHAKGVHSGSSFQLSSNVVNDDQDVNSVIMEDDESASLDTERTPFHGPPDVEDQRTHGPPSSGQLSSTYQLHHRGKFESTPNLSLTTHDGETLESSASDVGVPITDSLYSAQEGNEYLPMKRTGSPVPSVYAASLFGVDEQPPHNHGASNSKVPSPTHNHSLMNFSPKFGTTLRKLRNRSLGGSGSSKEELSDISEPENSSQIGQRPEGYGNSSHGYNDDAGVHPQKPGELLPSSSSNSSLEEEEPIPGEFPGEWSESVHSASRSAGATPVIVLQKPSPHLGHTGPSTEGTFTSERQHERASMDDTRLQQYETYTDSRGRSPGPVMDGKPGSATTRPRRHSINHPPSIPPTAFISHHFLSHGLGVTPASPLRKEFALEDDEKSLNSMLSEDESTIDEQSPTNSDTYSVTSTSSPKHIQPHHSSTFRNIISTLGGKHKKKANTSPQNYRNNQNSYSAIGAVGMAGAMAIGRATAPRSSLEDDPFAQVGGADERKEPLRVAQDSSRHNLENSKFMDSREMTIEERKMRAGLGPLLESGDIPPTQSIMGKAIALDFDHHKEALHARPGYIGEYPTPVRMHSMLNREAAAVRSLIGRDEDDVGLKKNREAMAREDPPLQDLELSPSLPLDPGVTVYKSKTMPSPKMNTTLPEPRSGSIIGEDIPEAIPVNTSTGEVWEEENLTNDAAVVHREHCSPDPFVNDEQELSEKHIGDCHQTMTRYQYNMMMPNRQPSNENTSPTRCIGEPLEDDQQQYQDYSLDDSNQQQQIAVHVVEATEDSQFLQASPPTPPHSVPEVKKSHHRNIFKRLIRRKSEDGLFSHHHHQINNGDDYSERIPPKSSPSSPYMSPGASKSQSSILTTSSSSSSGFSVPFLHFHKHHKLQQQLQPLQQLQEHQLQEKKELFDSSHPREYMYE